MIQYIIIAVVAVVGLYAAYIQIKTKRQGIEVQAQVVNVSEEWENDGDTHSLVYKYTVQYRTIDGETVTTGLGGMSNSNKHLQVGDIITVRYLPEKQNYPIMVRNPR